MSDNDSDRRGEFVTMTCERSGKYGPYLRNFKRDDTGSRKCECPFKLRCYMLVNKKWRFNVICGLHNHNLCEKLSYRPIACRLMPEEKECVSDIVQLKNILATLRRKRPGNISNIKQVYHITRNVRSRVKPAVGTKHIKAEDGKRVKASVIVEKIMDAWNVIVNSSTKELYVDSVIHFRKVCKKYPDLLKYV
ncbi:uncharacterized protein LOC127096489 [Lathyrus oleraceus]|uniref:uncharacterized protein LOC127096489 n=1 Tax=Pisum sativum TaxID=3888 RepID=UPI0021CE2ED6|nr:uncharacterized protein LOC127096489 [Pisum sativum]